MKNFLHLDDLDDLEIETLLDRARVLEKHPLNRSLAGKVIAILLMNPSLRTSASMQAGIAQLGGTSIVLQPGHGTWELEWRDDVIMNMTAAEHIKEALPVLEGYVDAIALRCFAGGRSLDEALTDPILSAVARLTKKPLINIESSTAHPCQSLGDWKTMDDLGVPREDGRFVLSWAYHPAALPLAVPASTLHMACRRGMQVTLLCPESHRLPDAMMERAQRAADHAGGSLRWTDDRSAALEGAHIIYAKSWGAPSAYGDGAAEAPLRRGLEHWCVDPGWFETAEEKARFMHCLPVRRNVVVRDEVLDSPRSAVVQQAHNRLHVQKSVLELVLSSQN